MTGPLHHPETQPSLTDWIDRADELARAHAAGEHAHPCRFTRCTTTDPFTFRVAWRDGVEWYLCRAHVEHHRGRGMLRGARITVALVGGCPGCEPLHPPGHPFA